MRNKFTMILGIVAAIGVLAGEVAQGQTKRILISNDDNPSGNSASFYLAGGSPAAPKLSFLKKVSTGGTGIGNGFFSTNGVAVSRDPANKCAYFADGGSGDIAGISIGTQQLTGNFRGSAGDTGSFFGIGLALSKKFLYASFTDVNNIGAFAVGPGCTLTFLGDVPAIGFNGFPVGGMALHGKILVVAYVDGSIESFNVSGGIPVSNGDEQFSTGNQTDGGLPAGVEITQDGHYAIFGDACPTQQCSPTEVEVSDISSGKIAPTVLYGGAGGGLGTGLNSNNVWLSPDETLLYISNNQSGQVTAAFFGATTGTLSAGCTSSPLKGFGTQWQHTVALATEQITGTGTVLWVAESGNPSSVGILKVRSNGSVCTLVESVNSPAADSNSPGLFSIGAFPPRPF